MKYLGLFSILFTSFLYAQNVNIVPQLKKVEAGKIEEVKRDLRDYKQLNASHPNVIFLEGVITEDGEKSQKFYEAVYTNFPHSQFADAALFRSFSYYYALGLYKKAEELKTQLVKEYPKSPYLKKTDRSFPEVDEMIVVESTPYKTKSNSKFKYTIQAGAFGQFENADNLKQKFINENLESVIVPKNVNNLKLHIVTVGKFAEKSDADDLLEDLEKDYSLKGRVIEID